MTEFIFKTLDANRRILPGFLDNYSVEQLNKIPVGFIKLIHMFFLFIKSLFYLTMFWKFCVNLKSIITVSCSLYDTQRNHSANTL